MRPIQIPKLIIQKLLVPLHPLFGVTDGRKYRVACYVALDDNNNIIKL